MVGQNKKRNLPDQKEHRQGNKRKFSRFGKSGNIYANVKLHNTYTHGKLSNTYNMAMRIQYHLHLERL